MLKKNDTDLDIKSSVASRGRRLKSLRKMANFSRKELTRKHGISASTMQAWEEGKSGGLTPKGARRIIMALRSEGLSCTAEWLLKGIGQSPYLVEQLYAGEQATDGFEAELNFFRQNHEDAIDMQIVDDSMYPVYQLGDIVAGKKKIGENIASAIGHRCIIETQAGDILCRKLLKGSKAGCYHLQSENLNTTVQAPFCYNVDVVSVATVIWHRKMQ